jgi:hypothetical protein
MKKKFLLTVVVTQLGMLVFNISGCATNRISLVDTNQVSVVRHDSEKIEILWTDVYQKDGQVWAYGVLKQRGYRLSMPIKTHVDVQVLSEDGSVHYETISDDIYVPRNRVGKGPDWKRFRVQLPTEILGGSRISMTVHVGEHKENRDRPEDEYCVASLKTL